MPRSNYPTGFADGVTIKGVPLLQTHPGKVFWVYNGSALLTGQKAGSDGNKGTFDAPFATIDYAIGQCTADRGDIIFVKAGHSETITAAAGIDADVAGIAIVGLGSGRNRPTINFTTATTADIDIDAANITFKNIFFDVTGIDAVVGALDVNAADFTLEGCEVLMADSGGQAVEFIVTATAADRMAVLNNVIRAPNAGANNAVSIEGTPDGIVIAGNRIYGDFADACIHNPTGNVATNLVIDSNYLQNDQTGDHAIELVSACTGTISKNHLVTDAIATAVDQGSCNAFDNLYYDSSDVDAGATPFPITTTTGGVSVENIQDALYGADGIVTFPAAAAPANSVSIAEVLREVYDQSDKAVTNTTATLVNGTTLFTIAGGPIEILSLVARCVTTNDGTASTLQWSADPTDGVAVTISAASASLANVAAGGMVTFQGTTLATAPLVSASGANIAQQVTNGVVVGAGIITSVVGVGSTTGTWQHHLRYRPLARGVTVT